MCNKEEFYVFSFDGGNFYPASRYDEKNCDNLDSNLNIYVNLNLDVTFTLLDNSTATATASATDIMKIDKCQSNKIIKCNSNKIFVRLLQDLINNVNKISENKVNTVKGNGKIKYNCDGNNYDIMTTIEAKNKCEQPCKFTDYSFLVDTYWCVPERSTTALFYNRGQDKERQQVQVVWHITDVINNEYIVGQCFSKFDGYIVSDINCMINQDGVLTMMFLNEQNTNQYSTGILMLMKNICPLFPFTKKYKELDLLHAFQMQVNLDLPNDKYAYLLHNAYMVQATPETEIWYDLPTTHNSIPEFIEEAIKNSVTN